MKRIVFLDYVRVFACFLVILVHASENFYGAAGSTDMVGPQSYLASETDRLWVAVYDGFSRMAVPLFMIVSAFLLAPMKKEQTTWQFYRQRCLRILPPFFIFMILYSTLPMLWGAINGETSLNDMSRILLNFPSQAGHLWFMYPLISLYLFIPIISPWLSKATKKEERFFIGLFLLSTCMPYLNRWCGEVWGQCFWNEYHMLWYFSGYLGYLVLAHYIRVHLTWNRSKRLTVGGILMIIGAVWTIYSFYIQAVPGEILSTPVIEIGWASYNGYIPYFHMHQSPKSPTNSNRSIKTQLWHVSHAYILARVVGNSIQAHSGTAYPCGYTLYCSEYIHLLFRNSKDHLIYTGQ